MKDRFLCVLAQYDFDTEKKLNEIQKALREAGFVGKQTQGLPNHITLGTFDPAMGNELKEQIKELARLTQNLISL